MSTISGSSNKAISKLLTIKKDSKSSVQDLTKDDFIVNDRVYIASNPDRMGTVAFNGKTKFSDGIWIGVALDKPFGKNSGVVQGVQYFQCDENHGIFVRSNNLRHLSEKDLIKTIASGDNIMSDLDQFNDSALPKETEEFSFIEPFPVSITTTHLNLGDRVYVAGQSGNSMHKNGILRFFGYTKFSDGIWAGIELDNPVGKNDGSVNGIRYFSCKPQYGLMALEHKVKKMDQSTSKCFSRMDSCSKYGSNESVSSIASNFSSASRTRVRLGMNAFKGDRRIENDADKNKTSKTNVKDITNLDKTSSAMQNVLKEKDQHVEQLMREREIERIDLATATAKIEELERHQIRNVKSFNDQKLISDMQLNELQNSIYLVCQERDELLERLDESKKKVDDLLFRIEEKYIDESDLEHKTEENESQIFELNEKLALERETREQLEKKLKDADYLNGNSINDSTYIIKIKCLEDKLQKVESELNDERNTSKFSSDSQLLDEKEAIIRDLQNRLEDIKSLNLEEKLIYLESELTNERNNSKVDSLSKLLEDKEIVIRDQQERFDKVMSLNLEEKLIKLESELTEERNNSKVASLSKTLEEKETVVRDLQQCLEEIRSLNLEEKLAKLESELAEERNNSKVDTLAKLLEEKENILRDLQERMEEVKSLNLEDKCVKLGFELTEERNNSKTFATLLEEKESIIDNLQGCLDEVKSPMLKEKLMTLESEMIEEKNNSKTLSKLVKEKEEALYDFQEEIKKVKSLNLEDKVIKLESELKEERNNFKSISRLLEEKETTVHDLQERLEDVKNLNSEEKLLKFESQLIEERNKFKLLSKLLEEKEVTINGLTERIEENKSLNLEEKLVKLEMELNKEKNDSKVQSLSQLLEDKELIINGLRDSFEEMKSQWNETKKEVDSKTDGNKSLQNEIVNLQSIIGDLNMELSESQNKMTQKNTSENIHKLENDTQTEEEYRSDTEIKEIQELNNNLESLKTENDNLKSLLTSIQEEYNLCHKESEDKQLKYYDLQQKCINIEEENIDRMNSLTEENQSLCSQLSSYHEQLEMLRTQLFDLRIDHDKLTEYKCEIQSNEINLKLHIEQLKSQMTVLENENRDLRKSLDELENDTTRNSNILQMSLKIDDLESSIFDANAALKSEKEQNRVLIAEIAELHTKSENLQPIESNENNLKAAIKAFENRIIVLENENHDLIKSLDESEKDTTRSSCILQMSIKIDDLESSVLQYNDALKCEKEQNTIRLAKITTLQSEVELLKHRRDGEDNIVYDQMESLKSINQLLESDKLSLVEVVESKNSELIVIRDRLLKISQEYESLQEDFNEKNSRFESERRLLNDKVRKVEKQLDDHEKKSQFSVSESSEKRKLDNKDHISLLKVAKENSEQQISFLNSVIIDREKKFQTIQQENQTLKDKIKDLEIGNILPPTKAKKVIPLRLYCDTCEIFDAHDTENCTVIVDRSEPSSPQIVLRQVKLNAKAPRLYCDICEIFDAHDTCDCQDQQTF